MSRSNNRSVPSLTQQQQQYTQQHRGVPLISRNNEPPNTGDAPPRHRYYAVEQQQQQQYFRRSRSYSQPRRHSDFRPSSSSSEQQQQWSNNSKSPRKEREYSRRNSDSSFYWDRKRHHHHQQQQQQHRRGDDSYSKNSFSTMNQQHTSSARTSTSAESSSSTTYKIHPKLTGRFVPAAAVAQQQQTVGSSGDDKTATTATTTTVASSSSSNNITAQITAVVSLSCSESTTSCSCSTTAPGATPELLSSTASVNSSTLAAAAAGGSSSQQQQHPHNSDHCNMHKPAVVAPPVVVRVQTTAATTSMASTARSHAPTAAEEEERTSRNSPKQEDSNKSSAPVEVSEKEPECSSPENIKDLSVKSSPPKAEKISVSNDDDIASTNIPIGTRVSVYWDGEDEYFDGTVTQQRNTKKPYFVEYDDGDTEWIDLHKIPFRILSPGSKKTKTKRGRKRGKRVETDESSLPFKDKHKEKKQFKPKQTLEQKKQPKRQEEEDWVAAGGIPRDGSDDSDTDEEEVMQWATKMFGVSPPPRRPKQLQQDDNFRWEDWMEGPVHIPISEAVKLSRRSSASSAAAIAANTEVRPLKRKQPFRKSVDSKKIKIRLSKECDDVVDQQEVEEERRKKELARPLTAEEIRAILADDAHAGCASSYWVRRSVRQPSKSALNSPKVKALLDKLRGNDSDMVVLKMKKYINDPATPCLVIDAVLDALEENTNCEALFIQNFNEGMRDEQVMHLLKILQQPSCKIWCLNIGETYKVETKTWENFTEGLKKTKITHMYASEHTISGELKDQIRSTIRDNRKKHNMHIDADNLDVIVQCTHCWWNPINAKVLRPYLKKRGYEHIIEDKEVQGLRGSTSGQI